MNELSSLISALGKRCFPSKAQRYKSAFSIRIVRNTNGLPHLQAID